MTDPFYVARICPECGRTFVSEEDEAACPECLEYAATIANLPPNEGRDE